MTIALLVLHIHIEVADHDDRAIGPDAFLAPAEFAGLHVTLHDVEAILLIEGDTRNFIKADHIVEADQPALPAGVVDEHPGNGGLAARDEMSIRRNLLVQM